MRALVVVALLAIAACGGGGAKVEAPPDPPDPQLVQARRVAALAFEQGRYDQAASLYRAALERAQARDELEAIADIGYDIAVVELRRGEDAAALAAAQSARAELERRGRQPFAELALAEATAFYRLGNAAAAQPLAAGVARGRDDAARRARFLLGLIAADRRDATALRAAIASVAGPGAADFQADQAELEARLAVLDANAMRAEAAFLRAADFRNDVLDYPSMARALAGAAEQAQALSRTADAADLYLRAGRSALISGGKRAGERWLAAAERAARGAGRRDVLDAIAELRKRQQP